MLEVHPSDSHIAIAPLAGPIVLLVASLERDGAETQLVLLARQLQDWGWPVRIVAMLPINGFGTDIDDLEVQYLGMTRSGINPGAVLRFIQLVKDERPAALVSFTNPANLFGRIVGHLCGIPVIVSSIRGERLGGRLRTLAMRLTARLDTLTTANSTAVGASLVRRRLVAEERLRVIPNGIDLRRFLAQHDGAPELGAAPDDFVWLAVGRLSPSKDYPNLLQALHLLTDAPRHKLYVVGVGELREALAREAEALGLTERVTFLGRREDVPSLLAAADAAVLSSVHEGMPNVLMEALAAGRPAVATDVGGVREVMIDGMSGYVVPPRRPEALAEAMARLMAQPAEVRSAMGAAGRSHVASHFSVTAMAERWRALLATEIAVRTPRLTV